MISDLSKGVFGALVLGAVVAVAFLVLGASQSPSSPKDKEVGLSARTVVADPVDRPAAAPEEKSTSLAGLDDPEATLAAYWARLSIRDEISDFVNNADRLPSDERDQAAAALRERIQALEADGDVVPVQSIYLQAAIVSAQFKYDDQARAAAITALKEAHEARAPTPSTAHLGERFQDYKAREREIVDEVMALENYPRGLTREAYLRERLDALRNEIYAEEGVDED